jgi:hypothetical protein
VLLEKLLAARALAAYRGYVSYMDAEDRERTITIIHFLVFPKFLGS